MSRGDVGGSVRMLIEEQQRGAAFRLEADVALRARRHARKAVRERRVEPLALHAPRWVVSGTRGVTVR